MLITTEKIKIYNSYGGDPNGLERVGSACERKSFDSNDWFLIQNFYQDIELINKRLTDQNYIDRTFLKLKENCDYASYKLLTDKITFYKDFQQIAEILKHIKLLVNLDSDTVCSRFDTKEQFLIDLNQDIINIENCDFSTLNKIQLEFAPTSTYHEISISNGWSNIYIKLSINFDKLYKQLT